MFQGERLETDAVIHEVFLRDGDPNFEWLMPLGRDFHQLHQRRRRPEGCCFSSPWRLPAGTGQC